MTEQGYNGYKNRATWNVALWICNDYTLYQLAKNCSKQSKPYKAFIESVQACLSGDIFQGTPDGYYWNDSSLDIKQLDEVIRELVD